MRLNNTAHNIANVNTDDAKRLRTEQVESPSGGTEARTRVSDEEIDLAEEAIELRHAKRDAELAAAVTARQADIEDSVIDILA
ncbi:MAG: hypothetical protein GY926_09925 [bacterium]|nr:hypothetical protein [bacterium]